jgi:hypothetical protein
VELFPYVTDCVRIISGKESCWQLKEFMNKLVTTCYESIKCYHAEVISLGAVVHTKSQSFSQSTHFFRVFQNRRTYWSTRLKEFRYIMLIMMLRVSHLQHKITCFHVSITFYCYKWCRLIFLHFVFSVVPEGANISRRAGLFQHIQYPGLL